MDPFVLTAKPEGRKENGAKVIHIEWGERNDAGGGRDLAGQGGPQRGGSDLRRGVQYDRREGVR